MSRYWKFLMKPFMAGLVLAVLRFVGPAREDATAATLPKDPCALLKPAEIQAALAPNDKIGNGVVDTSAGDLGAGCTYTWGPRTNEWGQTSLSIIVTDASKIWPSGLSSEDIKQRVLVEAKSGADGSEIAGVGDGGVFTTEPKSHNAMAKAYVLKAKGVLLLLTFHGGNALSQKDKIIGLLKDAAGRL